MKKALVENPDIKENTNSFAGEEQKKQDNSPDIEIESFLKHNQRFFMVHQLDQ